jgi:hypothetical protein
MYRVYTKAVAGQNPNVPADYVTAGMGSLCEICVKQITLTDGVAATNTAVIGIAEPNVKIQTFSVLSLKLAAGSDYVSVADHPTTYGLANNVLTITVPADGAAIPAAAVLQVMYTVGV